MPFVQLAVGARKRRKQFGEKDRVVAEQRACLLAIKAADGFASPAIMQTALALQLGRKRTCPRLHQPKHTWPPRTGSNDSTATRLTLAPLPKNRRQSDIRNNH